MASWLTPLDEGPRCTRWKLNWSCGSRSGRHTRTKRFDGTKREANMALREFTAECERLPLSSTSFIAYATRWNDARLASGAIAPGTHDKYMYHIRAVTPYLNITLEKVRPSDIQAVYARLRASWTGTTLRSLHNSLHRIFRAAIADGLISVHPMGDVDAPRLDTPEKKALTPQEAAQTLSVLDVNDNKQFAVSLILRCGLRRNEVLNVEWQDVTGDTLHIRREITKSDSGVRDIPLDDETRMVIELRKIMVEDSLAAAGGRIAPTDKLCCGLDGRPLTLAALKIYWVRHRPVDCTLHELRHTYLTNLAQAGVHPAVMQRLAGHSSMRTTMQIYTHVHQDDMRKAVDALAIARQCAAKCASSPKIEKSRSDEK